MIGVLLVHDECLVRSVLAEWLRREPDLAVHDASWRAAPGRARSLRPDVCAADLDCADAVGIPPWATCAARAAPLPPPGCWSWPTRADPDC
ncbi:hypothetical protein [Streptomyces scabiei]|uniref:hypothetical protein n=1 Tax=Streptomyces scabiei TaxID=1930 RepID=UPI001FF0CBCE|nr:hypothetical protein [Streptomyces sp. LBUM 1480]